MTKWIKCAEKMPSDYDRKLVFSIYDGICTACYMDTYWDLDPKGYLATGGEIYQVTHWAELPGVPAHE